VNILLKSFDDSVPFQPLRLVDASFNLGVRVDTTVIGRNMLGCLIFEQF
jgi:hypothetical protein